MKGSLSTDVAFQRVIFLQMPMRRESKCQVGKTIYIFCVSLSTATPLAFLLVLTWLIFCVWSWWTLDTIKGLQTDCHRTTQKIVLGMQNKGKKIHNETRRSLCLSHWQITLMFKVAVTVKTTRSLCSINWFPPLCIRGRSAGSFLKQRLVIEPTFYITEDDVFR